MANKTVTVPIGQRYGFLTITAEAPSRKYRSRAECLCDCGNIKVVDFRHLQDGGTTSCGRTCKLAGKHGLSATAENDCWKQMRQRCENPKNRAYKNYGGRGIKVCDRWQSFQNFYEDMGPRPTADHSIDRIDVNGDYCPENCKWATFTEQQQNRRDNNLVTFNGETKCVTEWARLYNIPPRTLAKRLEAAETEDDIALCFSSDWAKIKGRKLRMIEYKGFRLSLAEWGRKLGINQSSLAEMIRKRSEEGAIEYYLQKHQISIESIAD